MESRKLKGIAFVIAMLLLFGTTAGCADSASSEDETATESTEMQTEASADDTAGECGSLQERLVDRLAGCGDL